jgi:hypothetical protein
MAYEMKFTLTGVSKAAQEMRDLKKAVNDATAAKKEYQDAAAQSRGTSSGAMSFGAASGGRGIPPRAWTGGAGPFGKQEYERSRLQQLQDSGYGGTALRDQQYRTKRADAMADKADKYGKPKTDDEKFMEMIMTSRIVGGKLSPLVGKAIAAGVNPSAFSGGFSTGGIASKMLPIVEAVAPFLIPAAIAAAAGTAVVALANAGSDRQRAYGTGYYYGGGTSGETGQLGGLGALNGMDAGEMGKFAQSFGDALRSGGYGSAVMRANGVVDQGVYTLDKSKNLIRAIDVLRSIDENTAMLTARTLGAEDLLRFRDTNDLIYQELKNSAGGQGSQFERKVGANYDATKGTLQNDLSTILSPVQTAAEIGLTVGGQALHAMWYPFTKGLQLAGEGLDAITGHFNQGKSGSGDKSATDKNTEAINQNTRTLKDHAERIGFGPRAGGAVPIGWTFQQGQEALKNQARMLGAFGLVLALVWILG